MFDSNVKNMRYSNKGENDYEDSDEEIYDIYRDTPTPDHKNNHRSPSVDIIMKDNKF